MNLNNLNIKKIINIGIVVIIASTVAISSIFFYSLYKQQKNELRSLEGQYITKQKESIKKETLRALRYIEYKYKTKGAKSNSELQREIVDTIEHMRNERDGTGYIFIYTFNGVNIADPILKENKGKNLIDFKDPNGKLVIKELIDIAKAGGGYVQYVWNKPTTNKLAPKISYAVSFKPLEWMIGTGVYIDDINKQLEIKKQEYKEQLWGFFIKIILFILSLLALVVFLADYFAKRVSNDLEIVKNTLLNVSKEYKLISKESLHFKEIRDVADSLNSMIKELKVLNNKLENKIKLRTKELEESQEYALNLVKSQDRFLKDAVHEINTPLSIIITNIDLFKLKFGANRYLSKIEAASKIIQNIYEDLSYLIKKDRVEYKKEQVEVAQFLTDRVEFFSEIAEGNSVNIVKDFKSSCTIYINKTLFQRVVDNTLSNAIKYSYENREIVVSLYKKNSMCYFEIKNFGDVIENSSRLFDRFYRENSNRGGFGLGLNIIKEISNKNSIIIEVESKDNTTIFRYIWSSNEDTTT